jgi:tagatose 1,6-diphosphate aldolase
MVPAYHFRILLSDGADAGHINFRAGDTEHVRTSAGHIGYEVKAAFRGHGYAGDACRALAPFVGTVFGSVIITCDPGNLASQRTIERLGAEFLEEVTLPPSDPQYQGGSRAKRRYRWAPGAGGDSSHSL